MEDVTTETDLTTVADVNTTATETETPSSDGADTVDNTAKENVVKEKMLTYDEAKKLAQKRIDQLTWEKHERERKIAELEERLKKNEPVPQPKDTVNQSTEAEPKEDDFTNYTDFVRAHGEWVAKKVKADTINALREERAKEIIERTQGEFKNIQDHFEKKAMTEGVGKYADYMEVAYNPNIPYSDVLARSVFEHSDGLEIAYYLGKNPDVVDILRFVGDPAVIKREFDKIAKGLKVKPRNTAAPAPIKPIGGNSGSFDKDLSKVTDVGEFIRRREAEIEKRRLGG